MCGSLRMQEQVACGLYAAGCNWALEERGAEGLRLRSAGTRAELYSALNCELNGAGGSGVESLSSGLEEVHSTLSGTAMEDLEDIPSDEQVLSTWSALGERSVVG